MSKAKDLLAIRWQRGVIRTSRTHIEDRLAALGAKNTLNSSYCLTVKHLPKNRGLGCWIQEVPLCSNQPHGRWQPEIGWRTSLNRWSRGQVCENCSTYTPREKDREELWHKPSPMRGRQGGPLAWALPQLRIPYLPLAECHLLCAQSISRGSSTAPTSSSESLGSSSAMPSSVKSAPARIQSNFSSSFRFIERMLNSWRAHRRENIKLLRHSFLPIMRS